MTQKQNKTQQNITQSSVDGADYAIELYQEFDAALDKLFDDGNAINGDVAFDELTADISTTNSLSGKNGSHNDDMDAYVKDDHFRIQFQGEKKRSLSHNRDTVNTRHYDDTPQARDTVLDAYKTSIRKKEAEQRVAHDLVMPSTASVVTHRDIEPQRSVSVFAEKHDTQNDDVITTSSTNNLDTSGPLGGRAGLSAELTQSVPTRLHQRQDRVTNKSDAVRLHAAMHYTKRRTQKIHPSADETLPQETKVTYHKKISKIPKVRQNDVQEVQETPSQSRYGAIKNTTSSQKTVASRPPQYFQLGRAVSPGRTETPTVVTSHYQPQGDSVTTSKQPAGEGIVKFFRKPRENVLTTQSNNRAHATLGTATFSASTSQQRSFAEVADRVRRGDDDEATFLDDGKITFTKTQAQQLRQPSKKIAPQSKKTNVASVQLPPAMQRRHTSTQMSHKRNVVTVPQSATLSAQSQRTQQTVTKKVAQVPRQKKRTAHLSVSHASHAVKRVPHINTLATKTVKDVASADEQKHRADASLMHVKSHVAIPRKASLAKKVTAPTKKRVIHSSQQQQSDRIKKHVQKQVQKRPQSLSRSQIQSHRQRFDQRFQLQQQSPSRSRISLKKKVYSSKSQRQHKLARTATVASHIKRRSKKVQRRMAALTFGAVIVVALAIFALALARYGVGLYVAIKNSAENGFMHLQHAVRDVKAQDFSASQKDFQDAAHSLGQAHTSFSQVNSWVIAMTQYIPILSKVASGKNAIDAGQHIARAGIALSKAGMTLKGVGNPLAGKSSLLKTYQSFATYVTTAREELNDANTLMEKISSHDIPAQQRAQFIELRKRLPIILAVLKRFEDNNHIIADILGANGPRKYLFLFQNNHEMRATGGFIGSYGRVDISNGVVRRFFIDGIFNPDGQLYEKVIPPRPIQKISAAWSLHDSNWFPHFPTSAEEAIVFYERTGGPTVDGVIAITPVVLQQLLAVTGPVHLPEYEKDITAENFMERLQQEVEIDYDKAENKPKKILSDLAPIILERIFTAGDGGDVRKVLDVIGTLLTQKHIQLYARNHDMQQLIIDAGWGGTIKDVPGDYLSVINTNINGFKTDGVVKETIYHWAEVQEDGSIIDTVRIVRKHTGGQTPYAWWNKVNADYMRIYVPKGSKLLRVSGQTREFVEPPLDYHALGFQADARVADEEQSMTIDDKTGTRTYVQNNKTVFANWVYVSPQETVTVEYVYRLPFRIGLSAAESADTYSVFFQKQAGSIGSHLISEIVLPQTMTTAWSYPRGIGTAKWETMLTTDQMRGVVIVPSRQ